MKIGIYLSHLLLLTVLTTSAYAAGTVVLANGSSRNTITKSFEIFEDKNRDRDIKYIHGNRHTLPFKKINSDSINLGFSNSIHWMHAKIINTSEQEDWLIEVCLSLPRLCNASIALMKTTGISARESGDMVSFKKRDIPYRTFVFKLQYKTECRKRCLFQNFR